MSEPDSRPVCIVGLGMAGLSLAVQCAASGRPVVGTDVSELVVAAVDSGMPPLNAEADLAEATRQAHERGLLRATMDTVAAVSGAAIVVVCVPVGLTESEEVDFHHLDSAALSVGAGLRAGTLVVLETPVPVGTTRGRFAQLLQSASGVEAEQDFLLAFSPWQAGNAGPIFHVFAQYPKLVGGTTTAAGEAAGAFYRSVQGSQVQVLSSAEAAEYAKLVQTTYRDVNIALANEFALYAEREGLDVMEVISAANSQPHSHVLRPGVGVGGPSVPVLPYFLFSKWNDFRLPPLARAINDSMAAHGVDLLENALGTLEGARVLILGLTYAENAAETANTSAKKLARELRHREAEALGHDPHLSDDEQRALKVLPTNLSPLPAVDAIILHAKHASYSDLDLALFPGIRVVLDGRGALTIDEVYRLRSVGLAVLRVGVADPDTSAR